MWFQLKKEYNSQLGQLFTNTYCLLRQGNNAFLINFQRFSKGYTFLFFKVSHLKCQ